MAKIDITKLEGYKEDMTDAEKLSLVLGVEVPDPLDATKFIKKDMFDKTASELAEAKKQLKAKMTEAEVAEAERLAEAQTIKAELETLRKQNAVNESKARFIALGYDETLASDAAEAMATGDTAKVFECQKAFTETFAAKLKGEQLNGLKDPPPGKPPVVDTDKMSDDDYFKNYYKKE